MTKKRSAKNAFISSLVMLCLCVTMLVGTTFAWYTDSVTSGRNTIVAGSLDMVIQVYTGNGGFADDNSWTTVNANTKIFADDLDANNQSTDKISFEPGAARVAYVRVTNDGDLAFKYSIAAVVDSETAGTNQADQPFYLSNFLHFGTATTAAPYATRDAAITAVAGNDALIKDVQLNTSTPLAAGSTSDVIALVIYMPSTVGNDANPKPGAQYKPSITFGLNALATQYVSEEDGFGSDYDAAATLPAMTASADVVAGETTVVTSGPVTVTVPDDATDANDTELTLTVENFTDNTNAGAVSMDITLVDQDNNAITQVSNPIVVEINVGPGKAITSVSHNSTPVTNYTYNDQTGILRFETASFSPFAITYKVGKGVSNAAELEAALAAKEANIILLADITGDKFSVVSDTFIDGDGHKITDTATDGRAIWIKADNVSLTLKNLTIDGAGKCQRGVQVNTGLESDFYDATIIIDNCTIKNVTHYAINLCSHTTVDLTITKSTISGWAAINAYGTGNVITVKDSELIGINPYSGSSNAFCTICLEGDTTGQTTLHSADYTINIEDSAVSASRTGDQPQCILGFNDLGENSSVTFKNCTFSIGEGCYFGYDVSGKDNTLIIDGETIDMPSGYYFNIA